MNIRSWRPKVPLTLFLSLLVIGPFLFTSPLPFSDELQWRGSWPWSRQPTLKCGDIYWLWLTAGTRFTAFIFVLLIQWGSIWGTSRSVVFTLSDGAMQRCLFSWLGLLQGVQIFREYTRLSWSALDVRVAFLSVVLIILPCATAISVPIMWEMSAQVLFWRALKFFPSYSHHSRMRVGISRHLSSVSVNCAVMQLFTHLSLSTIYFYIKTIKILPNDCF